MIAGPADTLAVPAPAAPGVSAPRYHSLDALRGTMMLLGIWLHAVVAYSKFGGWPWKDSTITTAFDWTLGLIHAFRMPAFYVLAGFFSALLVARRGAGAFARNRAMRILLPFVAGWLVLFPMVVVLVVWASRFGQPDVPRSILGFFTSGQVLRLLHPMHLWFLEYLLLFYALALAVRPLACWRPAAWSRVEGLFRAVFASRWRTLVLAGILFPFLCVMENGWLDDPKGFAPEGKIVAIYLVFFVPGWLLYRQADLLPRLGGSGTMALNLALGLVGWALAFTCHEYRMHSTPHSGQALAGFLGCAGLHALAMWGLIFGLMGLFLRFLERPIGWLRYLSDSSYWLYLAHMPALLVFQIALIRSGWPPVWKMFTALGGAMVVLLASYQWLVRPTWVGAILNGRRYRPGLPRVGA